MPDVHSLDIGICVPYAKIYDGKQGYLSELPYIYNLHIEIFAQMHRLLMLNKATFVSCLIFTVWTLELLSLMHRLLTGNKVTFLSCLIITIWTLKFLAHMHRFMMYN